jgi:uncharacterized protein (DUF2062 family)
LKKRYLRDRIRELVKFDEPPHRLAVAFALGVFIAFSPWLGFHFASAVALAWIFRLNKVVVLTACFINNPWTMVPMYAFCLWFGVKITGSSVQVPDIAWQDLGFRDLFLVLKPFLLPFVAGTLALGVVMAIPSYYLFLWAVKKYRREEKQSAEPPETVPLPGRTGETDRD